MEGTGAHVRIKMPRGGEKPLSEMSLLKSYLQGPRGGTKSFMVF